MALHGTIRVNDVVLGYWTARRKVHPPEKTNTYEVAYEFMDIKGVRHHGSGELVHDFSDSALVLASKVLAWAAEDADLYPETPEEAKNRI